MLAFFHVGKIDAGFEVAARQGIQPILPAHDADLDGLLAEAGGFVDRKIFHLELYLVGVLREGILLGADVEPEHDGDGESDELEHSVVFGHFHLRNTFFRRRAREPSSGVCKSSVMVWMRASSLRL